MAAPTGGASDDRAALARHLARVVEETTGQEEFLYVQVASSVRLNKVGGKDQELRDAVYAMTRTDIWAAGRTVTARRRRWWQSEAPRDEIGVIRVPYREIQQDVMHEKRPPYDYYALMDNGMRSLMIIVDSPQIAYDTLATRNEA